MATVKLIQSSNSNHSQAYSLNSTEVSNNHPQDVSFSSYLKPAEEAFVNKLVQPGRSLNFNTEPEAGHRYCLGSKEEDSEIGVFKAEKYFNGEINSEENANSVTTSKKLIQPEDKTEDGEGERGKNIVKEPMGPRGHMGTPSIHSESSMNSQNALLQNIARNPSRKKGNKVNTSRRFLAAIGCKCSCSDNGSVDVVEDENITNSSPPLNAKSSNVGVFPIHNSAPKSDPWVSEEIQEHKSGKFENFAQKTYFDLPSLKQDDEVIPRKSLEVFGSPLFGKKGHGKETFNLEKRLTMLSTWDANLRKEAESEVLNETESDASSDLFEIESLTGKVNSYLTRQTSNATSDCLTATTTRYAPSEVSIEWSVVTASADDFSVLSDTEDAVSGQLAASNGLAQTKNVTGEGPRRLSRPGILLGCKSQKAVQVAGEAHRASNERFSLDPRMSLGRRSDLSANPVARFQARPGSWGSITNTGSMLHIYGTPENEGHS